MKTIKIMVSPVNSPEDHNILRPILPVTFQPEPAVFKILSEAPGHEFTSTNQIIYWISTFNFSPRHILNLCQDLYTIHKSAAETITILRRYSLASLKYQKSLFIFFVPHKNRKKYIQKWVGTPNIKAGKSYLYYCDNNININFLCL